MTNRDKLYKVCTYDLLCKINDGLMKIEGGGDACVLDALNGHFMQSEYCGCGENRCDKCILEWLDKDANSNK